MRVQSAQVPNNTNEGSVSRDDRRVRMGVLPSLLIVYSGMLDDVEALFASTMVGCPVELISDVEMVLTVRVFALPAKLALR